MSDIAERIASLPPEKRALLAARLANADRVATFGGRIPRREATGPAPLSYTQQSVWFLEQLYPGNVAYNSPVAIRFTGRLDLDALERSWNEVIRRHDVLRAVIGFSDATPTQRAAEFRPSRLPRMDIGPSPGMRREEAALREAIAEAQKPFDLATGPLYRAKLLRCAEEEHILVVTLHHIVCDGWSMGVLVRELVAGYEASLLGESSPLPEPALQYADYAAWQRQQLAGPNLRHRVEQWRKRLEGFTGALQLPLDKPRPVEPSFRGDRLSAQLPPEFTESLHQIARAEGATLFMVLFGAFNVLLSRYTAQTDIVIGSQVANRERSELEGLIGFFANTQALRTDLSDDPSFLELLGRVREVALSAYDSQEVPFEKLVEELEPERQLNRNPFFDVCFSVQNFAMPTIGVPGLGIELLRVANGTSKFDLSLGVLETERGLSTAVEYCTDLFDASTAARLLRNYRTLLEGIIADPRQRISRFPLLAQAERHQLLVEWKGTAGEFERASFVHEMFEKQVKNDPQAVALIFEDQKLTYLELNMRANRLAHHLVSMGVQPEGFVGIALERSIDMIVALLATLKAGAAYLPLDVDDPEARLAEILADAAPAVVICREALCGRLPTSVKALAIDTRLQQTAFEQAAAHDLTDAERIRPLFLSHGAYVIYTSGSTGSPKGVVIEHAALAAHCSTIVKHYELSAADRVMQFASLSFDASVEQIFPTLIAGASLVVRGREIWTSRECRQKIRDLRITVMDLPPGYWNQLVRDWANDRDDKGSSMVRLILVGGEAMPPQSIGLWQQTPLRAARLLNAYGPTEATITATTFEVPPTKNFAPRIPIGKPLPGRVVYILDGNLEPVPVGATGELYLAGACLARGYLNRGELTEDRFIADPYSNDPKGRMYRTGDLGRWHNDGTLELLGRVDKQVKIRGFRVELGEIESALAKHPRVDQCAVTMREEISGESSLVGYIVPKSSVGFLEVWPCPGDYLIYDAVMYYAMTHDEPRNRLYRQAIDRLAKGKTVLDLGTGKDVVWARYCAEAGARKVYAVEVLEEAFQEAKKLVQRLGLSDVITVLHGDGERIELPEPVDLCVSELIGAIGNSEGAVTILNSARRWLKADGAMIPSSCRTRIAAFSLPDASINSPAFTELSANYVRAIFAKLGGPADIRVCLKNPPRSNILSEPHIFEELDFSRHGVPENEREIILRISKAGALDGFLLWVNLYTFEGAEPIDSLARLTNWLPVYFPVFDGSVEVTEGDTIVATCGCRSSQQGANPDYWIRGCVHLKGGQQIPFSHQSLLHPNQFRSSPFYAQLFDESGPRIKQTSELSGAELRASLKKLLPDFMVPSAFVVLDQMPLTPSGKLDTRALPAPERQIEISRAPRTPEEENLCEIFADLLALGAVGIDDNFFSLGGHSLLAMQLVSRVGSTFGVEIAVRTIFEAPTVAELAARLREAGKVSEPPIRGPRPTRLPLSYAQQRLWFLDRLEGSSTAYHMREALRLRGELDRRALDRALSELVKRHESLRTRIEEIESEPYQVIETKSEIAFRVEDLSDLKGETQREAIAAVQQRDSLEPFDLAVGPLVRTRLLKLAERDHILMWTCHHVISDGWSVGVFNRELGQLYEAFRNGRESTLDELPLQYADYAIWQRSRIKGKELERLLDYWRGQLAGAAGLELPADRLRPPRQSYSGSRHAFLLEPELNARLREFNRRENVTPFMSLLAAFEVLLFRLSGQEDISVGTPIANRPSVELEKLIGFFVNTLVIRADLSGAPSFRELVSRVRRIALDAYHHQDLPFDRLVEELKPERDMSRHPFFQVMFALQNSPEHPLTLTGLELSREPLPSLSTRFDLELHLAPQREGWAATFVYNQDLFDSDTIGRMAKRYVRLLEAMLADPDAAVGSVPMLSLEEEEQIVLQWNATAVDYPRDRRIEEIFAEQAQRTPDAVAAVFGEEALRYGELEQRSTRLANFLHNVGVREGMRVSICIEPSVEMVVGLLGILKAGAVYVPIDPKYPLQRISFMLEDTESALVLTRKALAPLFEGSGVKSICLDGDWEARVGDGEVQFCARRGGEPTAYVIYTSGSTGKPKGVCVPHRAVLRLVVNCDYVHLDASDVVAQLSNCCFDAVTFEIWGALLNGSRLAGIGMDQLLSLESFSAELEKHGVTTLFLTTALFNEFAHQRPDIFRNVRTVLFGGEECDPGAVGKVLASGPPQRLVNVYGPTETTTFASWYLIPPDRPCEGRIPIGRPISNTQIYILDSHLKPVTLGVIGEICIGGDGVASGYLNRPELTADRFIESPFVAGQKLYRTGDRARFRPDGNIDFLGRLDRQVKIRGFRIELGEIEAALAAHPSIRQVAVVEGKDGAGDKQLVSYVVASNRSTTSAGDLLAFLKQRLPDYMVPAHLIMLDALPLTASGKIDRNTLPAPRRGIEGYRAPRTPVEEILCGIFADVLHLDKVSIDEGFFSLGGHSLLAMQLISRVRATFGVELPVRAVFEAPAVGDLAARVFAAEKARSPLARHERPERPPLSFSQQRLWFLDRFEQSSAEYNMGEALRLRGELDVEALERAIQALVERHETLRTSFGEHEGEPFQIIAPELRISLPVEDLSGLEENLRQQTIQEALRKDAQEPFDLSRSPLLRIRLLKLAPRDHILLWSCHHIISDGWSAGVFNRELSLLYASFSEGRPANLADLPVQYADYALWERRQLEGKELERQLAYWRGQLSELPVLELPIDRPRPALQIFEGSQQTLLLPSALCNDLQTLSKKEGATMAMLQLAAFELLLGRLAGGDDVAVGLPIAGRNSLESEGLIGLFGNTLVVRAKLDSDLTFRQLLAQVRASSLEAYAHQEVPFEKLVEVLNPDRALNRHPLFEVLFNYLSVSRAPLDLRGLSIETVRQETFQAKFPMTLYLEEIREGLMLRLAFQTALFFPERIAHVLDQFHHLLIQIAANPDRPIRVYSLVAEAARGLLPDPTISLSEPEQVPVPDQFLSIAQLHPGQAAVRQDGEEWTYQELAISSTKIARLLTARGIQPGDIVAVSGPCSFGLISGVMGILMARGVLLMLDSSLPSARRDLMLEAASGKHWLSVEQTKNVDAEWSEDFRSLPLTRISREGDPMDAQDLIPEGLLPGRAGPEDPAYVFFTSGTTGVPKGILGTHKGLSHFLQWEREALGVACNDRIAQLTGLSFDVVLRDIFLPLTAGATLCLPDTASAPHENLIVPWLLRERITILHTVPSLANAWLDGLEGPRELPDLRWILFAGEPLLAALVQRWREKIGTESKIFNLYGPTETTLAKCAYRLPPDLAPGVQPIGSPLPNTQALIVNKADQLCGIGEPGEIVIRTAFRTLGYLNGSSQAATGFSLNPFCDDAADVVYRTGDCGSYDIHGRLRIAGRLDDQIKIRGSRVEPAEVAAVLAQHPAIQQSAVVVWERAPGEKILVAYFVLKPAAPLVSVADFRQFLRQRLPDYMVPGFLVRLEKLPLTSNGKLDRRALPAPDTGALQGYVAPRNPAEQALAAMYSELLNVSKIGVTDDFFELGGHSLIATRLVSHICKEFDVEIPLRAIFETPTVEGLARQVSELQVSLASADEIEELLADLESLPETNGELIELEAEGLQASEEEGTRDGSPFFCPKIASRSFGTRLCNLVIIINEQFYKVNFERIAKYVQELDPSIKALVIEDRASREISLPQNPNLIFSPALIRHPPSISGRVFCGYPLSKSEEYAALEKAGIAVPKWALLDEDHFPDLSGFEEYLVKKPNYGGRGAGVKIVRKDRVKWKPITTRALGISSNVLLQRFIYTGPRPVCYRVTTLFGKVLYSHRSQLRDDYPELGGPDAFRLGGRSIVASARGAEVRLNYEPDIIRFGELAHGAFPQIPLLGFDIVREEPSGKLFVLEANAIGYVWPFDPDLEAGFGYSAEQQFDGVRKAAYILAQKTQQSAG